MLGIARYQLAKGAQGGAEQWWLNALSVDCASLAYYTRGLAKLTGISALWYGLIGNVVVIVLALIVASVVGARSTTAGVLVLPVLVWTTYATAIVVGEMKAQRLI